MLTAQAVTIEVCLWPPPNSRIQADSEGFPLPTYVRGSFRLRLHFIRPRSRLACYVQHVVLLLDRPKYHRRIRQISSKSARRNAEV